jgi:CRISPR/Cas system-associated exonuclease Cas4 (RecB family)
MASDITMPLRLKVADAVDAAIDAKSRDEHRPHLGASVIGDACDRRLWYTFRWAERKPVSPRVRRLFDRGHLEERRFVTWLRQAGVEVQDVDPSTGKQFKVAAHDGHFGGSMDAIAHGVHDAPKTWHICEFKTHNEKSFKSLVKDGLAASKPRHYAQCLVYMRLTGMTRTLYGAINKNDDALEWKRVKADDADADRLIEKALRVIKSDSPPVRCSEDPTWWECKLCDFRDVCHEEKAPEVNCRTCMHSTPLLDTGITTSDDGGAWKCEQYGCQIPIEGQRMGCERHRYIPTFFEKAARVDEALSNGDIQYRTLSGATWINGEGPGAVSSEEMRKLEPGALVLLPDISSVKAEIPSAKVVDAEPKPQPQRRPAR